MKPITLKISAWGSYPGEATVDFTRFNERGLFLITGPTGAGKTTIFDAICYALYGDVSGRNREKTTVRSDYAPIDAMTYVELVFTHNGTQYRIFRSPKYERPKKRGDGVTMSNETAELMEDGNEPVVSVNEVNRRMNELLGINYEQFKKIAMIAQGEFLDLLIANSKDRVEILRNLFKTEKYEQLQAQLTLRASSIGKEIDSLRNKMDEAIHLLDVSGNEELEELVASTYLNYEKIIQRTRELVAEDENMAMGQESQIKALNEEIATLIEGINAGKSKNEAIVHYQAEQKHLHILSEKEPEMLEMEKQYLRMEQAQKVRTEERIYLEGVKQHGDLHERICKTKAELALLKPQLAIKEEEFKAAKTQEEKVVPLSNQLQGLHKYSGLLKDYDRLGQELAGVEHSLLSEKQKEGAILSQEEQLSREKEGYTKEFNALEDVEEELGRVKVALMEQGQQLETIVSISQQEKALLKMEQELSIGQEIYQTSMQATVTARELYQAKEEQYRAGMVGIVAKMVQDGMPCPVCGSLEHPLVAKSSKEIPDEQELEALKAAYEKKQTKSDQDYLAAREWSIKADQARKQLEQPKDALPYGLEEGKILTEKKLEELQQQERILGNKKNRRIELRDLLLKTEEALQTAIGKKTLVVQQIAKLQAELGTLQGARMQLVSTIPERYVQAEHPLALLDADVHAVEEEIQRIKVHVEHASRVYEDMRQQYQTSMNLWESDNLDYTTQEPVLQSKKEEYEAMLLAQGFAEEEVYHNVLELLPRMQEFDLQIREYKEERTKAIHAIENLSKSIGDGVEVDLDALQTHKIQLEEKRTDYLKQKEKVNGRISRNQVAIASIVQNQKDRVKRESSYGVVKDLEKVAKGKNKYNLVFEQYVLGSYFEDIIYAANLRLRDMSNGQYELMKVDKVADARTTDSLNLEVLDNHNGKKRPVTTLSGGESFKAALSLALGLSDVVQSSSGGIRIETMFIDEGFGSLDSESLDQALDTLMSLTEHNHLIGIISHVNELKERIENQIVVEKNRAGSSIKAYS